VTQSGRELMERIFPAHALALDKALSGLNDEEKLMCAELLKRLGKEADRLL
jgi:MarR family transcriptional regulator, 2-MHQ and catechol-resistance regulon repressor